MAYVTNLENILEAHERIKSSIHMTPVLSSESINHLLPAHPIFGNRNIYFKCESMQKTGSFKARGALNAVLKNNYTSVTTHSSGNHGQALAWAAQKVGIPSIIVMPENSPKCKQNAVLNYGGEIKFVESTQAAREAGAKRVTEETGAAFVHPYDNPDVISGQGTIALEFLSQVENLDVIIIPLGGGGFCSGVTLAAKSLKPGIKIIGIEPAEADDIYRSKLSGERQGNIKTPVTLADGLKANVGELTWPIIRDLVDDVITVTEEEIVASMRLIWERMKIVIEPSAAVGLAGVLTETFHNKWLHSNNSNDETLSSSSSSSFQNIGIIICGGNVDLDQLGVIFKPTSPSI